VEEFLFHLMAVLVLDSARRLTLLRLPMARESRLFLALNFNLNISEHDRRLYMDPNDSLDHVARFVEGILGLKLDLTLGEAAALV